MANVPCTIVIKSLDLENLPPKMLFVVSRELFRFGVKQIVMKNEDVLVSLSYSPKTETMRRKLGNLPVRYVRLAAENTEDVELFGVAMKRYKFNVNSEEEEKRMIEDSESPLQENKATILPSPLSPTTPTASTSGTSDNLSKLSLRKKRKPTENVTILENVLIDEDDDFIRF
ncbi:hypothetical protein QE152_g23243 [Popillia japonica]|uniref:Uncharacterized protein n=1 Tax=Popillia japonica TaxID=7064 RepID=A0AAW1KJ01_POPJA